MNRFIKLTTISIITIATIIRIVVVIPTIIKKFEDNTRLERQHSIDDLLLAPLSEDEEEEEEEEVGISNL